ncbi:hypothetical protein F383_25206 [Gossypium arboreum]|uniref:Uncharacterized protein n=1 Tax=Gossypium arboreum TaxID=29729 RepID=A0A0B0MQD6_GOSAR|nr:hypothetical protein F383_25206 [Gossypium arboreum]
MNVLRLTTMLAK